MSEGGCSRLRRRRPTGCHAAAAATSASTLCQLVITVRFLEITSFCGIKRDAGLDADADADADGAATRPVPVQMFLQSAAFDRRWHLAPSGRVFWPYLSAILAIFVWSLFCVYFIFFIIILSSDFEWKRRRLRFLLRFAALFLPVCHLPRFGPNGHKSQKALGSWKLPLKSQRREKSHIWQIHVWEVLEKSIHWDHCLYIIASDGFLLPLSYLSTENWINC